MSADDLMSQLLRELTDTTVTDLEVAELLTTLSDQSCEALGVTAAGVVLVGREGRLELKAWSNGGEQHAGLFRLQTRQGPCLDAVLTNHAVAVADLAADLAINRWPSFTPAARITGFRSAAAIPMRSGHRVIGALGVLRYDSTPLDPDAVVIAQALADEATTALLGAGSGEGATVEQLLGRALGDRVIIEQAKGIIAERDAVDIDEAFSWIREHARVSRRRLVDVAVAVLDGIVLSADRQAAPVLQVTLPSSARASGIARQAFDAWAAPLGVASRVNDDARLIVSELVTNAVTHARSAPTLTATKMAGVVRIEVRDDDPTLVAPGLAAASLVDGSGGHGLWVVQRLSESWGCDALDAGKVIWSEIR
ncbi:MAG: ANTAR domain-containing protein [Ilumatobacteraceae bacterium]